MPGNLLVIDSDHEYVANLQRTLTRFGFTVRVVETAAQGFPMARSSAFDLVILEVRLPDRNGLEICRILQSDGVYPPIVVLTQNTSKADAILALNLGADAFISKESDTLFLVAHVEALLRRRHMSRTAASHTHMPRIITVGPLTLDVETRKFRFYARVGILTQTESRLLAALASAPERVFTRDELLERVWGPQYQGSPNAVNTLIKRLRRRIAPSENDPQHIMSILGRGYVLSFDSNTLRKGFGPDRFRATTLPVAAAAAAVTK